MPRVVRQIRIDPEVEEKVQQIADKEGRSFSNAANWLLKKAAEEYLSRQHPDAGQGPA